MQEHGIPGDVEADRAAESVRIPLEHATLGTPRLHEAVVIAAVPDSLAPAVAGHIGQDFRMPRGELVHLLNEGRGSYRFERHSRERRQRALVPSD